MKVCIDPGHGFANQYPDRYDPGAVYGAINEADIALAVAQHLRDECLRRRWSVYMTRQSSRQATPVQRRAGLATMNGCDCLVSIHCNAFDSATAQGTETLYRTSRLFAASIQRQLVTALGTVDRGVKARQDLAVLKFDGPSAMVELAFLSNPHDRAILIDPFAQQRAAVAIADGLTFLTNRS